MEIDAHKCLENPKIFACFCMIIMTTKQNPCQMELLLILNFLMFSLSQYVCFFHGSRKDGFDPSALFEAAGQLKLQFLAEKYAGCWAVGLPGCFGLQTQRL